MAATRTRSVGRMASNLQPVASSAQRTRPMRPAPRCAHCGEVIGVYEPLVAQSAGSVRETSLAVEPQWPREQACCYHRACFELREAQ
jgi:hypothetical protein